MYYWQQLTNKERGELLRYRRLKGQPLHNTPHLGEKGSIYHVTSAFYKHQSLLNLKEGRMADFQGSLLEFCKKELVELYAWVILPNHYHLLLLNFCTSNLSITMATPH